MRNTNLLYMYESEQWYNFHYMQIDNSIALIVFSRNRVYNLYITFYF